jgi:hypothetical protein
VAVSDGKKMQPMAGARRDVTGITGYETREFAKRRKTNRKRRELAQRSRKANRG